MNDHREAFERDLKARLAIDPSSDLQARIRARAFSAPAKRMPLQGWFAWTSGLAAAAAAIVLLVIYSQPKASDNIPTPRKIVVKVPVAEPPTPVASRPTESPAPTRARQPVLIEIPVVAAANTGLNTGQIVLPPLRGIELTTAVAPLPEPLALSIASLEPINIEPLALAVQNLGVNE